MHNKLSYIKAVEVDDNLLTETAISSKKYWGYTDKLIEIWKPDLTITRDYLRKHIVYKIFHLKTYIGFYGIVKVNKDLCEIDHLWLLPEYISKGYGRFVFRHILSTIGNMNIRKATLTSEPNAKVFYEKMGGRILDKKQSKVSGRWLDVYEFVIHGKGSKQK